MPSTRKFTPPANLDTYAEYAIHGGNATIVAELDYDRYIGYFSLDGGEDHAHIWFGNGADTGENGIDLHDIPERRTLYREFGVLGRHVITCDPDGAHPHVKWEPSK